MKTHLTFEERQQAAEAKAAAKEAQKNETQGQKAERLDREAGERRARAAKGSASYAFTVTQGPKKGQGRTILNAPSERPKGKMALKAAKKAKVRALKAARGA